MPEPDETLDAPVYEPPRKRRLTLVAFMVGVLIVGLLGVLLIVASMRRRHAEPRPRTTLLVAHINLACENFRLEYGQYPWAKVPEVTATTEIKGQDVYAELRGLPGAKINTRTDYLGEVPKMSINNGMLVDNWGREIRFRVNFKGLQAVIWSCGRNGVDETNDGESPDSAKYPKGYYWFGKGDTGDDTTSM